MDTTALLFSQFQGLPAYTASLGVELVGNDFRADLLASGGLKLTGNEIGVEPADFAGAGLIDDGADNMAIDWSTAFNDAKAVKAEDLNSIATGEGASIIGIEDASAYYTGASVEAALDELEAQIGGATSSTFNFTENNVLADDDAIYAALEKLDLKHGDYSSTAPGEGASLIGIEDAAGNFTATTVEGALTELYSVSASTGVTYTVGAGGVSKGDLCYISAADTILPYSTLTNSHRGIGLALTTEAAAASVTVMSNDTILTGILVGATAGTPYYWNGTVLSSTIPSGAGAYVWQAGVAKNATDLHVEVRPVKKNA
jgi:hypothetical protein